MNYRHAYHAGNFADVVKHIVFSRVLQYFMRKDAPFLVLDTHAGVGRYDLTAIEPQKTLEFTRGVSRFLDQIGDAPKEVSDLCASYCALLETLNDGGLKHYPGSPLVAQSLIQRSDRLSLVELHPTDYALLTENFNWAKNTKTHNLDAWQAMKSQLPPKEKRGIVLIDPPFEDRDEFNAILRAVHDAQKRFSKGTYMIWYPIKDMPMVESFVSVLSGMALGKSIDARLMIDAPGREPSFIGTGMIIINPPYVLEEELKAILPWLTNLFEVAPGKGKYSVMEIIPER